jgi:hypothetical protein
MKICIRCKKEFECWSGRLCRECILKVAGIVKADTARHLSNLEGPEIEDRFEILDL